MDRIIKVLTGACILASIVLTAGIVADLGAAALAQKTQSVDDSPQSSPFIRYTDDGTVTIIPGL